MPISDSKIKSRAFDQLKFNLGVKTMELLNDPRVVEIMLNPDGSLWVEKLGEGMTRYGEMDEFSAMSLMETVATYHSLIVDQHKPILECEFPLDNSRFAGQIFPCVPRPSFTLRKKAVSVFTLDQYMENGIVTPSQCAVIRGAVAEHKNILVIGGTGSGKTTLVNAVIREMVDQFPDERVVIIEDTGEIQCTAKNYVQFHTSPDVSMTDLLRTTLRMRPDRILVGEVRGKECLDLLMAWNTGHEGGAATVHANNPAAALDRLALLISMNADYPKPVEPLIAGCVHYIVHIARAGHGREIRSILKVNGYDSVSGRYLTENVT